MTVSKEQVIPFVDYLNSKHPNIQFTHELENSGSLSFLDINIARTVASPSLCFTNQPQQDSLLTLNNFIPMAYTRKEYSSL